MKPAESFIKTQLPVKYWPLIPPLLKTAYQAVNEVLKNELIFTAESAQINRGRFISYAVDSIIERAVINNTLPCSDYRWRDYARPTGKYLELIFENSTASISLVKQPSKQPRDVVFRANARLSNQLVLDLADFKKEQEFSGMPHFLLVHGHQSLNFCHLGLPAVDSQMGYLWRSKNLMKIPHLVSNNVPKPEDTDYDFEQMNLLKEEIEKWKRDNE